MQAASDLVFHSVTPESLREEWKLPPEAATDSAEPPTGGDDGQPDNKTLEAEAHVRHAQGEDVTMRVLRELRNEELTQGHRPTTRSKSW